ncbi:hypothetical protein ABZV31_37150 [Streptomyces sp. NPDC005202]|uniref:MmyB family transcriptional regulator n=1 Tax=Streptomyces sp. NPDC005202 TaxID=3157021 RepID=UPI0033B7BA5D
MTSSPSRRKIFDEPCRARHRSGGGRTHRARMETARYPDEPRLANLVEELTASDARFRRWWSEHDVAARGKGTKILHHPRAGELTLDWDTLNCGPDPDQHIIIWTAAPGSPSRDNFSDCGARHTTLNSSQTPNPANLGG